MRLMIMRTGARRGCGRVMKVGQRGTRCARLGGLWPSAMAMALLAATVSGCATPRGASAVASADTSASAGAQPTPSAQPLLTHALKVWSGFPVTATPRPVVMVGSVIAGLASGFPNDEAKIAFGQGAIDAPPSLPSGPATTQGYPLITAAAAWHELTTIPRMSGGPAPTKPLVTTAVQFGSATFQTDRGKRDLPAWLFSFQGVAGPAAVLAAAPQAVFVPPGSSGDPSRDPSIWGAHLGADGRTLTIEVIGAPAGTGPCTADYTLDVAESRTAVAFLIVTHPHDGAGVACQDLAVVSKVTTTLSAALGARVVVSGATAQPVAVTMSA